MQSGSLENPVKKAEEIEEKKESVVSTTTPALIANYVENEFHIPIPHDCYCPITLELMRDPWMAADGYSYEGAAIRQWLDKGKRLSPMTGEIFAHTLLQPNHTLRTVMQDLLQKIHPGLLTILKAKSDDMKSILLAIELREKDLHDRAEKLQQKLDNLSQATCSSNSSSFAGSSSSSGSILHPRITLFRDAAHQPQAGDAFVRPEQVDAFSNSADEVKKHEAEVSKEDGTKGCVMS